MILETIISFIISNNYTKAENINNNYLNCIAIISDCISRLKSNSNFDMCIDMSIIKMWEEVNEESNRG